MRIAVVGCGRIGRIHLAHLSHLSARASVVAACDARLEAAMEGARPWEIPARVDLETLFELDRPAAVVIATPPAGRAEVIEAAAARGIAIFTEKPLALTLEDARRAEAAVTRAGVVFQIGFQRRFDRPYREAKQAIEWGKIGDPIAFRAVARDAWRPTLEFARLDVSGGLLVDMATHDFDLARWLMSTEVAAVSAFGSTKLYPELAEVGDVDSAVCNLAFRSGAIGNIEASRSGTYGYDIRTEVVGTRGAITIGGVEDTSVVEATSEGIRRRAYSGFEERFHDAYRAELEAFLECVASGVSSQCGIRDAVASVEIALAARESMRTGAAVSLAASASAEHHASVPGPPDPTASFPTP